MSQLHICFVEMGYPHHHGGGGGAGTYVQLVGKELIQRGHCVSVITMPCRKCPRRAVDGGIDVYRPSLGGALHWHIGKLPGLRIGALSARYLEYGWQLYRFLNQLHRKQPIDLVEFTEGGDFWHSFRAPFPYVVHLHGSRYTFLRMAGQPVGRGEWYYRSLELAFIRRARYVMSPSQALLNIVTGEIGHPLQRATAQPYPLDPRLLNGSNDARRIKGECPTVVFAARNDPVKGGDTLISSVPIVKHHIGDVEFQLFGYTPTSGTQLPDTVRCHSFVTKEELLTHYQRADLCVVPSKWDNSPNTIYEAMAAGKAVVASRVGGIPELVADGETGILVRPNDPEQLAAAIVRLLRNDEERLAMGRKARDRIRALADLDDNVNRRVEVYGQVISEWSSRKAR